MSIIDELYYSKLSEYIRDCVTSDQSMIKRLTAEIQPLRSSVRPITPRTTTSISVVGTDGGNNTIKFDPYMIQIIRVVDSNNNEYWMEAVTPNIDIAELNARHLSPGGKALSPLGEMMQLLGVSSLSELSPMIPVPGKHELVSPGWIQVYRELMEWAILLSIIRNYQFGSDTLVIFDGLLRSKVFARDLFTRGYIPRIQEAIGEAYRQNRRRIYLVGLAKRSKVLDRYRLVMWLEGILTDRFPSYVEVPRELELKTYIWSEYARGDDTGVAGKEVNKFVAGKMFFAKFGDHPYDPVWPVDILQSQVQDADIIMGHLLADALNGFPVPFYPLSLQRAHDNAALVDFDFRLVQDLIIRSIRDSVGSKSVDLDVFRLIDSDPSRRRYDI